jgi:hypothetical protein
MYGTVGWISKAELYWLNCWRVAINSGFRFQLIIAFLKAFDSKTVTIVYINMEHKGTVMQPPQKFPNKSQIWIRISSISEVSSDYYFFLIEK